MIIPASGLYLESGGRVLGRTDNNLHIHTGDKHTKRVPFAEKWDVLYEKGNPYKLFLVLNMACL